MKGVHYITIGIALALIGLLYFGGNTVAPAASVKDGGPVAATSDMENMAGRPMVLPADFDSLLAAAKKKLSPDLQAEISKQEHAVTRGDVKQQQIQANEALGKIWLNQKKKAIAGHYFGLSGKLENSDKKLNFAAHLLSEEMFQEANPNVRQWMAEEAISYYSHSLDINPDNDTVKIDLAEVFINGTGETMKGIEQLLSIVRKEPTHIQANLILGRMAVESGQLDKAIERGNTVISVDPDNIEARLFLGEAYKRKGEREKAIEVFEQAKKIMPNPDFAKDLDAYMKTF